MEEIVGEQVGEAVFGPGFSELRKDDFMRLFNWIELMEQPKERKSLQGRLGIAARAYVKLHANLEIKQIEYGVMNPFDLPVLNAAAQERRQRVFVADRVGPLKIEGKEATQHKRILDGFSRLHVQTECFDSLGAKKVMELAKLYKALRSEGSAVSRFAKLEQLLANDDVSWERVEREVQLLENSSGDLEKFVKSMEQRIEVLTVVAERRERIRERLSSGFLDVVEFGSVQHNAIIAGFTRMSEQVKKDEFGEFGAEQVRELEALYNALRDEGYDENQFEQLGVLLADEKISWAAVEGEIQFLENPESRKVISMFKAGWEVGEQVFGLLKRGEITWGDAKKAAKTRHERIQDGYNRLYERGEQTNSLEDTLVFEVADRYDALAKKERVGDDFAALEEPLGDDEVTCDLEAEKVGGKIELREVAWLAAKTLSRKEITGQQVRDDIAYLADGESRKSISWWGVTKLGSKAAWNAMRSDSDDGITWKQVETVVGPLKYDGNDETVSAKHLAWLGLELLESAEVNFEQVDGKLRYLVKPENRATIGWRQVAKMGAKALWRAMTKRPSKGKKQDELIMLEPLTKGLPSLKAKLRSVDGVMVAKVALGLAALVGIGLIAYNFEAIWDSLTGKPVVPDVQPPPVTPIPVVKPPPVVVTKPPVPPVNSPQGLHLHNGVWGWGR